MEEVLHDVPLYRELAGATARLPDETASPRFRHVLDKHNLASGLLSALLVRVRPNLNPSKRALVPSCGGARQSGFRRPANSSQRHIAAQTRCPIIAEPPTGRFVDLAQHAHVGDFSARSANGMIGAPNGGGSFAGWRPVATRPTAARMRSIVPPPTPANVCTFARRRTRGREKWQSTFQILLNPPGDFRRFSYLLGRCTGSAKSDSSKL
jgi:hypothetical protein